MSKISSLTLRALLLFLGLGFGGTPAGAATPASGTLTDTSGAISYTSGPFNVPNESGNGYPTAPLQCDPASPCDDFALTLDLPAAYIAAHPKATFRVTMSWPNTTEDYDIYLFDAKGKGVNASNGSNNPEIFSQAVGSGQQTFTVRILPSTPAGGTTTTKIELVDGAGPGSVVPGPVQLQPAGLPPRFINYVSPQLVGNNGQGEFNIGFNPKTLTTLTLGNTQTLKVSFPELLEAPLPESCDATWTDVTDTATGANSNDPILFTDQLTGRAFVSQLILGAAGESVFAYTDDDGKTWSHSPSTLNGSIDHQTVAGGPYPAGGSAKPSGSYPDAVYYCSQSDAVDTCIRSDDGGLTFGAPTKVFDDVTDCPDQTNGQHGHLKVAPDGTVYLPRRACNKTQVVAVSTDANTSWKVQAIPNSTPNQGSDPSIALATDGTAYYCYVNNEGDIHVQVSKDKGATWINDYNIGASQGVVRAVFPEAVAGDPDRAACGFLGTSTPGNYQAADFAGIWYTYMAMTYDGGKSWHTVSVTPEDPVQGAGGVCTSGTTCGSNRNLLDFNEMTLDQLGRPMYGYDDGCIAGCVLDPTRNTYTAKSSVVRQTGGRPLFARFDQAEPSSPHAACLDGVRRQAGSDLKWKIPDNGGAAVSAYNIYRGENPDQLSMIAQVPGNKQQFKDTAADSKVAGYYYKIVASNAQGDGIASNILKLPLTTTPAESACVAPGLTEIVDPTGDGTGSNPASSPTDLMQVWLAEPLDLPGKLVVTMKVGDLSAVPPNVRWMTYLSAPDRMDYYVAMVSDTVTPTFEYGAYTITSAPATSGVATYSKLGALDAASNYKADGTITLVLDKAKIGAPQPGDLLTKVTALVRASSNNTNGAGRSLDSSGQAYYILRDASCSGIAAKTPSLPIDSAQVPASKGRFGGAMGLGLLLPLVGAAAFARRRKPFPLQLRPT